MADVCGLTGASAPPTASAAAHGALVPRPPPGGEHRPFETARVAAVSTVPAGLPVIVGGVRLTSSASATS